MYKNVENGAKIYLAFVSMPNTMFCFDNPTADVYNVPDATVTNYEAAPTFTSDAFDAMGDDGALSTLTIVHSEDSFGNNQITGTFLFETAAGRKGVIKTKMVNAERIKVDIKIQKY